MVHAERLRSEREFHDQQARQRAPELTRDALTFSDAAYLDHESWIRPALARLGDVCGRQILDLGCGHGMAAVVLGRRGARVTGLDLSTGYLSEARQRARANGVTVDWVAADAERLPFADETFDGIWGNAILHHIDLERIGRELARVLRPGGVAVFCEPWGENPLLAWARRHWPYPGKQRTPDEVPLDRAGIRRLRRSFGDVAVEGHQLLSMVGRVVGPRPWLARWDTRLLRWLPGLQRWCRYVVLTLVKHSLNRMPMLEREQS